MNVFELLSALIEKLEDYESSQTDKDALSVEGFIRSIQQGPDLESLKNTVIGPSNPALRNHPHHIENNIERVIAQHLLVLNRYVKFYSKIAFADRRIKTLEEFSMLITVMHRQAITKSDLIRMNVIEKSSGIEIINRMIKSGLLMQVANPDDLRSHLVKLTEAGQMELYQVFGKMDTLGIIAAGELSVAEKEQLAVLLKKLDHFHYENYHNKSLKSLEDFLPMARRKD